MNNLIAKILKGS